MKDVDVKDGENRSLALEEFRVKCANTFNTSLIGMLKYAEMMWEFRQRKHTLLGGIREIY